jgi:dephospho-CoA kinase
MKKEFKGKFILGVMGPIASGKDTLAEHLKKKYSFKQIGFGDILRAQAKKRKIAPLRKNLRVLQKQLREKYGDCYLENRAEEIILKSKHRKFILSGLRIASESAEAKKQMGTKIILVDADPFIRFERAKKRNRHGDAKTFERFKKEEKKEWKIFNFSKTFKLADYVIHNEGTVEELNKKIDKLMKKLIKMRRK